MWDDDDHLLKDEEALRALYGPPVEAAIFKEVDHLHPIYRPFVENATMMVLATHGRRWLDASPRGGPPGFVTVEDANTLLLPAAFLKFRVWERFTPGGPESGVTPVSPLLNSALYSVLAAEAALIGSNLNFPVGQSILIAAEKP